MSYSGRYTIKNPDKYKGRVHEVVYRSLWERGVMRWLDMVITDQISWWNSEETIIPYVYNKKIHRYFIDFTVCNKHGEILLIEIKPEKQTKEPKLPQSGRKTKKFISEMVTYSINQAKWNSAQRYADKKGYVFEVWTEKTLKEKGIRVVK